MSKTAPLPSWLVSAFPFLPFWLVARFPGWNARLVDGQWQKVRGKLISLPADPGMKFKTTNLTRILFFMVGLVAKLFHFFAYTRGLAHRIRESGWTWRRSALIQNQASERSSAHVGYWLPNQPWKFNIRGGPHFYDGGLSLNLSSEPTDVMLLTVENGDALPLQFREEDVVSVDDPKRRAFHCV